jgi:hypothetical protein
LFVNYLSSDNSCLSFLLSLSSCTHSSNIFFVLHFCVIDRFFCCQFKPIFELKYPTQTVMSSTAEVT